VSVRLATSFGTSAVTKKFCPPFSGCLGIFSNAHSASPPIAKLITEYSTSSLLNSGGRVFAGGVWLGPYRLHFRYELLPIWFRPSLPPFTTSVSVGDYIDVLRPPLERISGSPSRRWRDCRCLRCLHRGRVPLPPSLPPNYSVQGGKPRDRVGRLSEKAQSDRALATQLGTAQNLGSAFVNRWSGVRFAHQAPMKSNT
jgi:hypothetical protein